MIDLHMHTSYSDGTCSVSEILKEAEDKKLECISITDHDTVQGLVDAEKYVKTQNLSFVSGIEISTQDLEEIHILGYGIDCNKKSLLDACATWQNARLNRGDVIKDYLHTKGIDIDLDEVKSYAVNRSLGRPHFASKSWNCTDSERSI